MSTEIPTIPTDFVSAANGGTFSGGLTISGSVDSGGTDYGYYQSAGTNIVLKGDSEGRSGIFFESEKDGTNINDPSDYGFIQFHSYGYNNTSGEANNLVIGVANDSTDKIILQAPYNGGVMIGYKDATSGTGLTLSEVIHSNYSGYNNENWDTAYTHSQAAHAPSDAEKNVNADWNSTSGDSQILNNPGTSYLTGVTDRHVFPGLAASGTQARRHHIGRVYYCPKHWDTTWQNLYFTINEETYNSGYIKYHLFGYYNGTDNQTLNLRVVDYRGLNSDLQRYKIVLGDHTDTGWDHSSQSVFYTDIYVEVSHYKSVKVVIDALGHSIIHSNPTSGAGITVIYETPTITNITYTNETYDTTYIGSNTIIWNSANDGAGSGLDADTVDGTQASLFKRINGEYLLDVNDDYESRTGTWTEGTGSSWGEPNISGGHAYNDGTGSITFTVPTGAQSCWISHLTWSSGGYIDVLGVQSDGGEVFLRRINTHQTVQNSNEGVGQHDGSTITFAGTSLSSFGKIKFKNREGRFHFTGIAFSSSQWEGTEGTGMIHPKQITKQGSGNGLDSDKLDGQQGTYYLDYNNFSNVPTTFAPSAHNHDDRYYTETEINAQNVTLDETLAALRGWVPGFSNSDDSSLTWDRTEDALKIKGTDTSIGAVYKAMRVKEGMTIRVTVTVKGDVASTSGLYLRLQKHDGNLPDGKTHVSHDSANSSDLVQEDDSEVTSWYENGAISTDWVTHEKDVAITSDGYISFLVLNWTGNGDNSIWVKNPDIQIVTAADSDKLDGQEGTHYLDYNNFSNTPTIPTDHGDHDGLYLPIGGGTVTGDTTIEGDLVVGKDGTSKGIQVVYDDNHASGARWNTVIDIGKTEEREAGDGNYPTYVTDNGYSISFQSNSDGVLFGMEEYSSGNYKPVIAWGDDTSDSPFVFRYNNGVKASLTHDGTWYANLFDVGAKTGTWLTSDSMSDAIGWNASYGTYIGSNVGGTHYLRANGTFTTGGNTHTLWHSGNLVKGSGGGLDADTVDGKHANLSYGVGKQYDFTVNGDDDIFYPVVISGSNSPRMTRITVFRGYSETAPSTWNNASHKGGLTLTYDIRVGGWGGYPQMLNVHDFGEIYSRICGGVYWTAHTMKHVVWLRGGGASYHIDCPNGNLTIEVNDSTSASNYKNSTSNGTWYSYNNSNDAYDTVVQARTLAQAQTGGEELLRRMPMRYNGSFNEATTLSLTNTIDAATLDGIDSTGFATSSHNHDGTYLKLSGGTMNGNVNLDENRLEIYENAFIEGSGGQIDIGDIDGQDAVNNIAFYLMDKKVFSMNEDAAMLNGDLEFTSTSQTTSADFGIVWTGWDKEGVTDNSDRAFIRHDTNVGGHSGSVLSISSMNDATDGIAFSTHASSHLKHNGHALYSEGHKPTYTELGTMAYTNLTGAPTIPSGSQLVRVLNNQDYIASGGTSGDYRDNYGAGLTIYEGYNTGANRPHTYDTTAQFMSTTGQGFELSIDWVSGATTPLKIRSLRDCCQGWNPWTDVWTSHNFTLGTGGGLDADKVDGLHAASFIRSDAADTATHKVSFTAAESIGLKGARGANTNEYIHLYNKVGIGHPSGWGQGETDTPSQGLSTYGGMNISYGTKAASTICGNLNIGTASDTGNRDLFLHGSTANKKSRLRTTNGNLHIDSAEGHALYLNYYYGASTNILFGTGNGGYCGTVSSAGVLRMAGDVVAYYSFSDRRLKTNIKKTENNLDKILSLNPVEYTWKEGPREGVKEIGLIAQEVEEVVPEVVRLQSRHHDEKTEGEGYKQVDYEHLVSTLIGAMQEQQKQIDELKSQMAMYNAKSCKCKK